MNASVDNPGEPTARNVKADLLRDIPRFLAEFAAFARGGGDRREAEADGRIDAALTILRECPDWRWTTAEVLTRFGPDLLPRLELEYRRLPEETPPADRMTPARGQTYYALLLVAFGSQTGVEELLAEVRRDGELSCLAAAMLTDRGVQQVGPLLIEWLRRIDLKNIPLLEQPDIPTKEQDVIVSRLRHVAKLGVIVPTDLWHRFTAPNCPPYVRKEFRSLWPRPT